MAPTNQPVAGDRVQDFEITDVLARTLLSEILLVRTGRAGGLAVVKRPGLQWRFEPRIAERFRAEQRLGQELRQENLVRVLPCPVSREAFVLMEYAPGRTLRDHLRELDRLDARRAVAIVRQLCSALTYLHERRIVHGSVRPEHIWITPDERVKLLDLGGVRVLAGGEGRPRAGSSSGGDAYRAPEQLRRGQPDVASDVYAAGAVLYELLTGIAPFAGVPDWILPRVKQEQDVLPPAALLPRDASIEQIVLRATARSPRQRYRSVRELEGALAGSPPAPRRADARSSCTSPRHPAGSVGSRRAALRLVEPPRSSAGSSAREGRPRPGTGPSLPAR